MRPPHLSVLPVLFLGCLVVGCTDPTSSADEAVDDGGTGESTDSGETTDADATTGDATSDDTTDSGEETTTDSDTTGDGDDGVGADDETSEAACSAFGNAVPESLIAATTAGDAATATIVPDSQTLYLVTLPDAAAGFISLEIPDWQTTQAFFTEAEIDYTVTVISNDSVEGPRELAAACPEDGITDQRIYFPQWTPATIEFSAVGPREIRLMIIQEPE